MKSLKVFFAFSIGYSSIAYAHQPNFASQYVKPITITIQSYQKGVTKEEYFRCTPETCCFTEKFYCFMENGKCICDLHVCEEWPESINPKSYWMEITGVQAERYCGRPKLHELTNLCLCNPDKNPPCEQCNQSPMRNRLNPREGLSLPLDCRPY